MKIEDVKIGDKVVPFQKTVKAWSNWSDWLKHKASSPEYFTEHGYLYVRKSGDALILSDNPDNGGDFFNASDFNPYIETLEKVRFGGYFQGNKTVIFVDGKLNEANYNPEDAKKGLPYNRAKGLLLAYMRTLGQEVEDIHIEINPCVSACKTVEDKPTFEVGDRVKIRSDLVAGRYHGNLNSVVSDMLEFRGKTAKIIRINGKLIILDVDNRGWVWSPEMLEKIPQPTKHEVFVDGVRYVKEELK